MVALLLAALAGCGSGANAEPGSSRVIRVAVIGGMVETGFWQGLVERFQNETGNRYKVEVVAMGPKPVLSAAFRKGQADLVTMHASDTIINLVADGFAVNPQPWVKNDLIIVGPKDDPAHIRGMNDAAAAFAKIASSKAPIVVHSSLGAQEVMRDVLDDGNVTLPSEHMTILFTDHAREVLKIAAEKNSYTVVGRIPFLNGKLPNAGLELMVRGDRRLRRPYVVATADPRRFPKANTEGAAALAAFLLMPETQAWIGTYGVTKEDDQPLFFPIGK
jgi:tungstate transport system substrate-binding protein